MKQFELERLILYGRYKGNEKLMSLHLAQIGDQQIHLNIKDYLIDTFLTKPLLSRKEQG